MIKRHYSDIADSLDFTKMMYDNVYSDSVEYASVETAENLGLQVNEALEVFAYCIVNDAEKEDSLSYLRHAVEFGSANFMYANNIGTEISFTLENRLVQLTPEENLAYKDVGSWLKALYASLILRNQDGLKELLKIDQSVFEKANIKPIAFDLAIFNLHKALFDSNANLQDCFQNIADASSPDVIEIERQDYIYDLRTPVTILIHEILTNNESGFNEHLEKALNSHADFWSKKENTDESYGWISIPLLAICALAMDNKGFNITIESEYIPKWLYKKNF